MRERKGILEMKADNALTFAFKAVYGRPPEKALRGRITPGRPWRGLTVDENLKDEWLEKLNAVSWIEIVSTEEGKNRMRVPHIVFYMKNPKDDILAQKIVEELRRPFQKYNAWELWYAMADIGNRGRPRIVLAASKKRGTMMWEAWWDVSAQKIEEAIIAVKYEDLEKKRQGTKSLKEG